MPYFLNILYLLSLLLLSPWLIYRALFIGKTPKGLRVKLFGSSPQRIDFERKLIWFHGVSVGEVHLLRQLINAFRHQYPYVQCVVSTTTTTGMDEAKKHFADLDVFYYPFDFTWSVRRAIRRLSPDMIVLAESELWPNFLLEANRANCRVVLINARMSPRSMERHRRLCWLTQRLWQCIEVFAVQTEEYADNFAELGIKRDKLIVTGSIKYDGIIQTQDNPKIDELRQLLSIDDSSLLLVGGSTQSPEEEVLLDCYDKLKHDHPQLRLILVPRQRERFDDVAALLQRRGTKHVRRTELTTPLTDAQDTVVLVDTIGELSALWALAKVAYVGGSLDGKRGGQNMIEPAALGVPVLFGPHVWNFRDAARRLLEAKAAVQITDSAQLVNEIRSLLNDPNLAQQMGERGKDLVLQQQGATQRTIEVLESVLPLQSTSRAAA